MADESSNPFQAGEAPLEVAATAPKEIDGAPPEAIAPVAAEDRVQVYSGPLMEAETIASALRGAGLRVALGDNQTVGANAFFGPVVGGVKIFVDRRDVERAQALLAKKGEGKPVFIVKRGPSGSIITGVVLGGLIGVFVGFASNIMLLAIPFVVVGALLGGRGKGAIYCSSPACGKPLELGMATCPSCGGIISGVIAHPDERLEAEERLREAKR